MKHTMAVSPRSSPSLCRDPEPGMWCSRQQAHRNQPVNPTQGGLVLPTVGPPANLNDAAAQQQDPEKDLDLAEGPLKL